mmetsp:Transcript_10360/g.24355  ORF Transcript_10360/g.24355 Transcript_10360/m.24355 type:complete len:480 (-) Transcript_10360:53-1492(-)|eukprot:CAMPEP_0177718544 /NCGR_PEP_ID=MMETSP0484_2-20121128/15632_1 /TAXON_ID=354590 /ORGANISM="Rhodomonas lens, Strain RHODO" /LENGTH=479 /DNA_ID=CAMNT_0019230713 /DNA_START=80 /DNA_END=1519 /DNA_ORIENTATION=-
MRVLVLALCAAAAHDALAFTPAMSLTPSRVGSPGISRGSPLNAPGVARKQPFLLPARAESLLPQKAAAADIEQNSNLAPWRQNLDLKGWADEVRAIEKKYRDNQSEEDVKHMKKMLSWSYILYAIGLATAPFAILPWNPISAICISTAICVRWTMIGHHVSHGGYSAQVGIDNRFHRSKFGRGPVRRFIDWCDWMQPEAWDVEHNYMHHYELGEKSDPDLLERNAHNVRIQKIPLPFRYAQMLSLMVMWKWFYYSPNTLKEMYDRQQKLAEKKGKTVVQPFQLPVAPGGFDPATKACTVKYVIGEMFKLNFLPARVLFTSLAPYFTAHFVLTPLVFYVLFGQVAAVTALVNLFAAEILTNIHSFIVVVPNHAGEDVYRFETPVKVKSDEFYLRAVIGSANFRTGGNVNDFMHGWLNYQIEHHMFPDMSMLSYQRMAPEIKATCEKYGVPYIQENVFTRLHKTLEIGVGTKSMKVWERGD